jgi:magnesium transporter
VYRTLVHHSANGFQESSNPDQISELLPDPEAIVWLDVQDPSEGDIDLLRREFGFHELALEDVITRHERAKVDQYEGWYFIVFYALRSEGVQEIDLFVGQNYLVTVHHGDVPEIAETAERWRNNAARFERGVGLVVYSLLDAIVDGYFPLVDELAERVEAVERNIFDTRSGNSLDDIFVLKRQLLNVRRVLSPQREVLNILVRRDNPIFNQELVLYFQDVYDHSVRVLDTIDLYREQLSGLIDAHLSVISNRLNDIMKRMTALATILMTLALIAGIYGMNFKIMPELNWVYGYPYALGLMAITGGILFAIFRHLDWL